MIDIMIGSVLMMVAMGKYIALKCFDDPVRAVIGAFGAGVVCLVGIILLMVGKWGFLDTLTERIERDGGTELEQWFRLKMLGLQDADRENLVNAVAVITELPPAQIASIGGNMRILKNFYRMGKVFTGDNFFRIHWPLMVTCIISVGLFVEAFV